MHLTCLKYFLNLGVGRLHELNIEFKPLLHEFRSLLCCNEVIFIGEVPMNFSVELQVDLPIKRRSIVGMPIHHHFRKMPIPIENVFTWIPTDVHQPIQILKCEKG